MGGLFSYDSKIMQVLNFVSDLILLNVLYLLTCIPIVTIGAAQAGLHTGVKVLLDKEDGSSAISAFFRGFTSGFGKITIAWCIVSLVLAMGIFGSVVALTLGAPLWAVTPAVVIGAMYHCMIPIFHSRFNCSVWQLIRNTWFFLFSCPFRAMACCVIIWVPVIVFFFISPYHFMSLALIWIAVFFSAAFCLVHLLMRKPITKLINHHNETHSDAPEEETLPDTEEETKEA